MIELSHFDLSSIITKLNQGVEETSAGHGSDFEKVLSEHLELSGIKSGKPYPLLNTPEEKIDQNSVSDYPGRFDVKNRSDLSSLTLSKFADQSFPDNEQLRGLSKTSVAGGLIGLEDVPSNKLGETLATLPVIESAPEDDSSQSPTSISFKLRPIDYFFDIESAEKDRLAKLTISQSEALRLGFENRLPEASRTREISDTTGQFLGFEDLLRQTENSSSTNNHGPLGEEFSLPQKPKTASEQDSILGHVNVTPVTAVVSSIVTENPNAVVYVDSNGAKASEAILIPLSTLRRSEASINKLSFSSAVTPGIFERNQKIDSTVNTYPNSELALTNASATFPPGVEKAERGAGSTYPNSELALTNTSATLSSGAEKTERGVGVERLYLEGARPRSIRVDTGNERIAVSPMSDSSDATFSVIQHNDNGSDRPINGRTYEQVRDIEERPRLRNHHDGPYIETLSGQRQVLVGGRQSRSAIAGLASELETVDQDGIKSDRTDNRKEVRSQLSSIESTITNNPDMQRKSGRDKAFLYSNEVQNRIRPRIDETSVSRLHGQPLAVDSKPSSESRPKDISKALELKNDAVHIKPDALKFAASGKINGLSGGMESTSSRSSAPMNLQPAETMVAAMVVNEEQPIEGMVKRLGPSSFQAELDLSGSDTRRGLLHEELDKRVGQLIRRVGSQIKSGQFNELHIKLHPRELGIVSFSIELLDGNDIGVKIVSASDEASKLLKEHWPSHWQDGGWKVSSQESGDKGLSGNSSNPYSEEKHDQKWENTSEDDAADSLRRLVEQDPGQDLAENDHNIDITV